jgi:hypothetical protein
LTRADFDHPPLTSDYSATTIAALMMLNW